MLKQRYGIANVLVVVTTYFVVAVFSDHVLETKDVLRADEPSKQPTPTLEFLRFDETLGEPYAILRLHNRTQGPIYFAAYGPAYPLQTWERWEHGKWGQCGYHSCGTGTSIQQLGADASLELMVRLREYKTARMPEEPKLQDYRDPMRLMLYFGKSEKDINHPIHSAAFRGATMKSEE
jgi:hypothetical protein